LKALALSPPAIVIDGDMVAEVKPGTYFSLRKKSCTPTECNVSSLEMPSGIFMLRGAAQRSWKHDCRGLRKTIWSFPDPTSNFTADGYLDIEGDRTVFNASCRQRAR
jgi:hypothetical protein